MPRRWPGVPSSCMLWKPRVIVPTWGWWNVLFGGGGAAGDLVAFPEPGEVRAFEQEFADEVGQVGGVGVGAGQGPQPGDAAADLVVPVGVDIARGGVQEQEPADVALC